MKTKPNPAPVHDFQLPPQTPRIIVLCLLAGVLLLLGLTGCKNGTAENCGINAAGAGNLVGAYTLVSVNGKAVPCVVSHEDRDVTVKSGLFTINADGTCHSHSVFSVSGYKDVIREVDAVYSGSATNLTMRWKGAGRTTGAVNGNRFTMNNEGMIFCYQK